MKKLCANKIQRELYIKTDLRGNKINKYLWTNFLDAYYIWESQKLLHTLGIFEPTTFVIIRERVTKLAGSIVQENIVRAQGKITVYEDIVALYPFTLFSRTVYSLHNKFVYAVKNAEIALLTL